VASSLTVHCATVPSQLSEEARLRALFAQADTQGTGLLSEEQLLGLLLRMGKKLSKSEQKRVMADIKQGGGEQLDYVEFRDWYLAPQGLLALQPWSALTKAVRASWEVLGWTARSWDGGGYSASVTPHTPPPSEQMDWAELSAAQQGAALELGYSESTWGEAWADLEPEVRAHWQTLGWTRAAWTVRQLQITPARLPAPHL
jgi:hypothetical protein